MACRWCKLGLSLFLSMLVAGEVRTEVSGMAKECNQFESCAAF